MCNRTEYINVNEESIGELIESEHYRELIASGNILSFANNDLHTIQNIRFINEFHVEGFYEDITLRNLIFDMNVEFTAHFRGIILFENIIFNGDVNFRSYFSFKENTGNNDNRTQFSGVRFNGNVDFSGFRKISEYKNFTFGDTIFAHKPENLTPINDNSSFYYEVLDINSRNYSG
ncbi:hypothetical protein [Brachyspira sp.]|uniref:hypothetical protein n=1 Tax=Brachyspira sp. TaxID=1977261 RepID=UPI003D7CA220